jgi:hypothetical protein
MAVPGRQLLFKQSTAAFKILNRCYLQFHCSYLQFHCSSSISYCLLQLSAVAAFSVSSHSAVFQLESFSYDLQFLITAFLLLSALYSVVVCCSSVPQMFLTAQFWPCCWLLLSAVAYIISVSVVCHHKLFSCRA